MNKKIIDFLEKYQKYLPDEGVSELRSIALEQNYFEKTFNNNPCTISIIDPNGYYLNVNDKMASLLNKTKNEIIGQKVGNLTKDSTILDLINKIKFGDYDESYCTIETIINNINKNFWININKVGLNYLVIGSDVTDFKNLEQEKQFSDKMAFLGEMSAFIVHEINNPLSMISMSNELIQMKTKDDSIINQTKNIEKMIETISKIISSLKIFVRKDNVESSKINLEEIVNQSLMILSGKRKKFNVSITTENISQIEFSGNEVDFLQVIVNLVSNSIEAVQNNNEKWIKIVWENDSLKIIDSGCGIQENIQSNLFKKFYTSKGTKGNGIGLYLSRELIRKWGFDLVYKLENGNTSFQLIKK